MMTFTCGCGVSATTDEAMETHLERAHPADPREEGFREDLRRERLLTHRAGRIVKRTRLSRVKVGDVLVGSEGGTTKVVSLGPVTTASGESFEGTGVVYVEQPWNA